MSQEQILFNVLVAMAFCTSMLDHYIAGKGYVKRSVRALLLGLYVATEARIAYRFAPAMWLYVFLNVWGLYWLFIGRRSPLVTHARSASGNPSRHRVDGDS